MKSHATLWICSMGEEESSKTEIIKQKFPIIAEQANHGDMLENSDASGYRSCGVYMISRANNKFAVVDLETEYDDYGSVNLQFRCITEFPLDYWEYGAMDAIQVTGPNSTKQGHPNSYWHGDTALVCLGDDVRTRATQIRFLENEESLCFTYNGTEYKMQYVKRFEDLFEDGLALVNAVDATTGCNPGYG